MKLEQRTLRWCAGLILAAVFLRLVGSGALEPLSRLLARPETVSLLMFMETGKVVRPIQVSQETVPPETLRPSIPEKASFSQEDADLVQVNSLCGYDVDLVEMLTAPLSLSLKGDEPTVLILHSHATESYTKTEDYQESTAYRTLDEDYNMVSIGQEIARVLEEGGIKVLHDQSLHDHPSYSDAYGNSRRSIAAYLEQYPSIQLVLDIHRDAVEGAGGKQIGYTTQVDTETAAQVMLVVGSDVSGATHPDWAENMALAVKLHAQLEKTAPGICRPISFRSQRFNQDQSHGAMLLEIGSAGNTRQEALSAARITAQAILAMAE